MSALYNLEPQPTAKVALQTTAGDIILELFAKQTPLASRNFLQHCLDGYYNDTIFHRVVPGFIIQGGDPTGTGFGGESSFENGEPFAGEFHSRLKYNRRGLLGMANNGDKDDNGSQFFFTLGNTPELERKNTLFGRVAGDTIYNVMKMADAELVEGSERPLYPTKITGAEILVNPFDDMVKRARVARATAEEEKPKKKAKRKVGKALLSFGGDEDGEDTAPAIKKPKFNPKLVAGSADIAPTPATSKAVKPSVRKPRSPSPPPATKPEPKPAPKAAVKLPPKRRATISPSTSPSPTPSPEPDTRRAKALKNTENEIAALKESMRRKGPDTTAAKEKPKTALESLIPTTSLRGRKRGGQPLTAAQEAKSLAILKAFKSKLENADEGLETDHPSSIKTGQKNGTNGEASTRADDEDEEAAVCELHFIANCQSCSNWTAQEEAEDDTGEGFLSHKLSFAKDRLGKDLEWKRKNEEELIVVDPREKARELGVEKVAKSDKKGREWDRDKGKSRAR